MSLAIRNEYQTVGVDNYYIDNANTYVNPHSKQALDCLDALWQSSFTSVLDLACGDGLITKHLKTNRFSGSIVGCDKFLFSRYRKETQCPCFEYSFQDIARQKHDLPMIDLTVISYAIDLVEKSYLDNMLFSLSLVSDYLLIIRPNSHLIDHYSWKLVNSVKMGKARGTIYKKNI